MLGATDLNVNCLNVDISEVKVCWWLSWTRGKLRWGIWNQLPQTKNHRKQMRKFIAETKFGYVVILHKPHNIKLEILERLRHRLSIRDFKMYTLQPWLVWLSGLSTGLRTKGSLVWFPVRAHAWVVGQAPSRGRVRDSYTSMCGWFLSLCISFPFPLSKTISIKYFLKKKEIPAWTTYHG